MYVAVFRGEVGLERADTSANVVDRSLRGREMDEYARFFAQHLMASEALGWDHNPILNRTNDLTY